MSDSKATDRASKDKANTSYSQTVPDISKGTREILEIYSRIPADQIIPHIQAVRDKAWDIFPYPCIGTFRFLDLSVSRLPIYDEIRTRLQSGDTKFLDLGCCFGQDIRRLVYDGVDSSRCYGVDLRLDFMEIGYDLFKDKDTLKATFIAGDIFDPDADLNQLNGKIDIIQASAFFHLFDLERQQKSATRIINMLKPQEDVLLVGRQIGNVEPYQNAVRYDERSSFRHNVESWTKFWDDMGEQTGTKWKVDAHLEILPGIETGTAKESDVKRHAEGVRWLEFSVRRLPE